MHFGHTHKKVFVNSFCPREKKRYKFACATELKVLANRFANMGLIIAININFRANNLGQAIDMEPMRL